ncbi:hypothetical protein QO001_004384 [Methylobacterium brachiatum]|jgi:hypothetical protein|uniref:Uncharacterized protein n=1 Tax=Methylobacterium brachiatum TaxID=269660 RepID=A0AAJ1TRD9_9HYPH|nr:hypothetical protein [Methylobacterium brachiatum]MCB4804411.1 hypothetical protein [Methylobacterium brachiatum]MDQ0545441.1 hypothetical protein [Methylobacterium brachiatum]
MAQDDAILFTRLADGTLLQRHRDGAFRPPASTMPSGSKRHRFEALSLLQTATRPRARQESHPGLFKGENLIGRHPLQAAGKGR